MKNNKITLQQAVRGYQLAAGARHLSQHTIDHYNNVFQKAIRFLGADVSISSITHQNIETFLDSFQNITNTTILHYYSALAALWTWALKEEIVSVHIVHKIRPPKPEKREIVPFNEAEIKAMLSVVARSKAYERPGKRKSDHALGTADRNRAILLMLVDTGLRASELCELQLNQLDHRNNRVQVLGKGSLERSVPFSPRTAQAIWRYLTSRPDARPDDPVFVTSLGRPLDRNQLRKQLGIIGRRASLHKVHPHRFRHTFAIWYLRNGGDPYTLQLLLGHSTLDMVKHYLRLAQVDIDAAHRRASPVDNWAL